jgi:septal ring factor EnvC (AmiA/AmiB activator)
MHPTERHDIEFMVRLRRIPRRLNPTSEQPCELVPSNTRPDWLDEQTSSRQRVAALEAQLARSRDVNRRLTRRLERRQDRFRQLRKRVRRQEAQLSRLCHKQERAVAALAAMQTSRRWRIGSAAARLVPGRRGRGRERR